MTMDNLGTWILIASLFILLINVSSRLGQTAGPYLGNANVTDSDNVVAGGPGDTGTGDFNKNFGATLFHPKVLALLLVIIVSAFAVLWIGYVG